MGVSVCCFFVLSCLRGSRCTALASGGRHQAVVLPFVEILRWTESRMEVEFSAAASSPISSLGSQICKRVPGSISASEVTMEVDEKQRWLLIGKELITGGVHGEAMAPAAANGCRLSPSFHWIL